MRQNIFGSLKGTSDWSPRARHTPVVLEMSVAKGRLLCVRAGGGFEFEDGDTVSIKR